MSTTATVIVNWNGREDTLRCLASLAEGSTRPEVTLVVDNGSTDGSAEAIRAAYPDVEVIALPANRHFAAGANAGLRRALDMGADFIWLLNNDVEVEPDALGRLVSMMRAGPQILGMIGPRIVQENPRRELVGARINFRTGAIADVAPDEVDFIRVDYVWGCAMMIGAETLREIGLFDESLVAYFEDADLCLRASKSGWMIAGIPGATVRHIGSGSANRQFLQTQFLRGRNWLRCLMRHARPDQRAGLLAWMIGVRLPELAWASLVTVVVRWLRPKGRPIRLWSEE